MKVNNPFSDMVEIMKRQGAAYNPPAIQLGRVLAPPPAIKIQIGDLVLDADNLLVSDCLLPNYQREYTQSGKGTISAQTPSPPIDADTHTDLTSLATTGQITWTDTLKVGDLLALMATGDRQTYIVLCKVVRS